MAEMKEVCQISSLISVEVEDSSILKSTLQYEITY